MRSLLHAITAAFHEVRDRYKQHQVQTQAKVERDGIAAEQHQQQQY